MTSNFQFMKKELPMAIILTIVTCGIYGIFWKAHVFKTLNVLLEFQKYSVVKWFFLSIITCGIYSVYIQYVLGQDILEIQKKKNIPSPNENLPVLSLVLSLFGLLLIADIIQQSEINNILDV